VQGIKVGHAIDDELLDAVPQRALDDTWIALGPVVAATGDRAHAVAVAFQPEAIDPMQAQRTERYTS
jgi:hypothetical protein